MKALLGGKGAGLAEMAALSLPVPPGFTITTEVCTYFSRTSGLYPATLNEEVRDALSKVEASVSATFVPPRSSSQHNGKVIAPLLVSVRSGARASMPGMMDTVLNLGLNDYSVKLLAHCSGNERFAYDCYRRFMQMFGNVVLGIPGSRFESILTALKAKHVCSSDTDLTSTHLRDLVTKYKHVIEDASGKPFEQDPHKQLWQAIGAVFKSWDNPRAIKYRQMNNIPHDWGTAVNVQAMVFGNFGDASATGVAFTRDPSSGENVMYGEFLPDAQGEDVVAGIRTPQQLTKVGRIAHSSTLPSMEESMPSVFAQLADARVKLEAHFRDVQDIEFTVQNGVLYLLQTRTAKRTARAAVKIAVDMVGEGVLSHREALLRVEPSTLIQLLHPALDPDAPKRIIATGLPASPGAACGRVALSSAEAERVASDGGSAILCTTETSPEDVHGMHAAAGVLTARGGMTSHAAVVARGMGRPAVTGANAICIDESAGTLRVGDVELREGDWLTLDGAAGHVMLGKVPTVDASPSADFETLLDWADKERRLRVLANAETPEDVARALSFGAEGVGLCRTEHMFFESERIVAVREMILAGNDEARWRALGKLLPMQRADFAEIFRIMRGLPVTIRLLDPPLHEFLPTGESELAEVATAACEDIEEMRRRATRLHEANPMLGMRGCRVGIMFPQVYRMQARAVLEAAVEIAGEGNGPAVQAEIMVPFVAAEAELKQVKSDIDEVAEAVFSALGKTALQAGVCYRVGTMIELPRAALQARQIARQAEFFSFGTNDLTQTAFGLSRDDAGSFLPWYEKSGLLGADPFVSLDVDGVGELVQIAVERGRETRADIKTCLCGEQGSEKASVEFCDKVGLDSVSCSPFLIPVARLAAAQASLVNKKI